MTDEVTDYLSPTPVMQRAPSKVVDGFDALSADLEEQGETINRKVDSTYLHPGSLAPAAHGQCYDCEVDTTYLHARPSIVDGNEEDTGEGYATIPLTRVDSSSPFPFEQ